MKYILCAIVIYLFLYLGLRVTGLIVHYENVGIEKIWGGSHGVYSKSAFINTLFYPVLYVETCMLNKAIIWGP
jgi:hypothetical protein